MQQKVSAVLIDIAGKFGKDVFRDAKKLVIVTIRVDFNLLHQPSAVCSIAYAMLPQYVVLI